MFFSETPCTSAAGWAVHRFPDKAKNTRLGVFALVEAPHRCGRRTCTRPAGRSRMGSALREANSPTKTKNTRLGVFCFSGGTTRNRTGDEGFADLCLTAWPWCRLSYKKWSGRRGSNPPPPPWQGGALPNELLPQYGASEWT